MKFLNCLFLIIGTAIGTGILALPLTNPEMGFYPVLSSMVITWAFMTLSAFMLLRAVIQHKVGDDFVTIARKNLGDVWQIATGISYLLLFYALLTVYILVGSSWLDQWTGEWLNVSESQYRMIFTLICAVFIFCGIHFVGSINQILSTCVILTLLLLVALGFSHIETTNFTVASFSGLQNPTSVMVTAFGFAGMLPALSSYAKRDMNILSKSLIIASVVILLLNILWLVICFGILGPSNLYALSELQSEGPEIVLALQHVLGNSYVSTYTEYFAVFALLSSLIGVSLSLYHFIIDSFKLHGTKFYKINGVVLTFAIPLLALLINPASFVAILGFAGIFVAIILGILPAALEIKMQKDGKHSKNLFLKYAAFLSIAFFVMVIIVEIQKII